MAKTVFLKAYHVLSSIWGFFVFHYWRLVSSQLITKLDIKFGIPPYYARLAKKKKYTVISPVLPPVNVLGTTMSMDLVEWNDGTQGRLVRSVDNQGKVFVNATSGPASKQYFAMELGGRKRVVGETLVTGD